MQVELSDELIAKLKGYAAEDSRYDDDEFNPADWSGGNFDDAFSMGVDEGYVLLAKHLVKELNL